MLSEHREIVLVEFLRVIGIFLDRAQVNFFTSYKNENSMEFQAFGKNKKK